MIPPFEIHQPDSASAASALLAQHHGSARAYAGGVALVLLLKQGRLDCRHLVDLKSIPHFNAIEFDPTSGMLQVGAGATHRQIERSDIVRTHCPAFADVEREGGNMRVRTVGTLGGNLCLAEPASDPGVMLLVHEARVQLERSSGRRELALDNFFRGPFEVALEPDEILTSVEIPPLPAGWTAAYLRFGVLERALVSVAAAVGPANQDGSAREVRIAVGCAGPRPFRAREAELLLRDAPPGDDPSILTKAAALAAAATDCVSDARGSAEYKRHLVSVLARRAVLAALASA